MLDQARRCCAPSRLDPQKCWLPFCLNFQRAPRPRIFPPPSRTVPFTAGWTPQNPWPPRELASAEISGPPFSQESQGKASTLSIGLCLRLGRFPPARKDATLWHAPSNLKTVSPFAASFTHPAPRPKNPSQRLLKRSTIFADRIPPRLPTPPKLARGSASSIFNGICPNAKPPIRAAPCGSSREFQNFHFMASHGIISATPRPCGAPIMLNDTGDASAKLHPKPRRAPSRWARARANSGSVLRRLGSRSHPWLR